MGTDKESAIRRSEREETPARGRSGYEDSTPGAEVVELHAIMPIQTNCADCTQLFHVPLPGGDADAAALNAAFEREGLKRGRLHAAASNGAIVLTLRVPFPLEALGDDYWSKVGKLVAATGELWWDFCATVVDHQPVPAYPRAHALSLYRVTKGGKLQCLLSEEANDQL